MTKLFSTTADDAHVPSDLFNVFAKEVAVVPPLRTRTRGPSTSFPIKLHTMLEKAEECGYQDVISWLPGGKSFQIHDTEGMIDVLRSHFNQTKYKSFLRQLQNYGFHRFTRGPRKGVCSHNLFVQNDPLLCLQMKRGSSGTTNSSGTLSSMATAAAQQRLSSPGMSSTTTASAVHHQANWAAPTTEDEKAHSSDDDDDDEIFPLNSAIKTGGGFPLWGSNYPTQTAAASPLVATIFGTFATTTTSPHGLPQQTPPATNVKKNNIGGDGGDDDSWLGKLLDRQDLWLNPNTEMNYDNIFEPNHVVFP